LLPHASFCLNPIISTGKDLLTSRPQLERYYNASYLQISLLFLSPVAGFIISTLSNHFLHVSVGRRGVAIIAGASQCVAYAISSFHPPYYGLVLAFTFIGLASGVKTASWNTFIGGLENVNEVLGLLHGAYGLGATLMPLFASNVLAKGWQWYMIYYVLVSIAASDMIITTLVFRTHNVSKYLEMYELQTTSEATGEPEGRDTAEGTHIATSKSTRSKGLALTVKCLKNKVVILCSFYLLAYVGSEVALGGWLVTFMIKVRGGDVYHSGIVASGLWAGITLGRIVLGFVTGRFFKTEKNAAVCYIIAAMALELMFWLIPSFVSSAVCAAFLGMPVRAHE
jgi:fucose permease